MDDLNPGSLTAVEAKLEPCLVEVGVGEVVQFERSGYFCKDGDSTADKHVFNRTVALRDSWAKLEKKLSQK